MEKMRQFYSDPQLEWNDCYTIAQFVDEGSRSLSCTSVGLLQKFAESAVTHRTEHPATVYQCS